MSPFSAEDPQRQLQHAMTLHRDGDLATAAQTYKALLNHPQTDHFMKAEALQLLAVIARQQGDVDLGLRLIMEALHLNPCHPGTLANCSLLLREKKRVTEAIMAARTALSIVPDHLEALEQLAGALMEAGAIEEAWNHYKRLSMLRPTYAEAWHGLALTALYQNQLDEAEAALDKAFGCEAANAYLHNTRGNLLKCQGKYREAIAAYKQAYEYDAALTLARVAQGMTHLLLDEPEQGYALYEERKAADPRLASYPPWQGDKVGSLIVMAEQGLGDTIQMIRYWPRLIEACDALTIVVQPDLLRLMRFNLPERIALLTPDDVWPKADAGIRMLSLPWVLNRGQVPQAGWSSYLKSDPAMRPSWQVSLAPTRQPRFGFVWAGNPGHVNDANRSLPSTLVGPFIDQFRQHVALLQKGQAALQPAMALFPELRCYGELFNDFAETAAALDQIDILITVDTSVAHLAGALGRPVWLLLPFDPDWRWGVTSDRTPHYPSMRLFRCESPRAWQAVMMRVAEEANKLLRGDQTVLAPPKTAIAPFASLPLLD